MLLITKLGATKRLLRRGKVSSNYSDDFGPFDGGPFDGGPFDGGPFDGNLGSGCAELFLSAVSCATTIEPEAN